MQATDGLRVAIAHYWLLNRRGGERVVEALLELFPQADLFALVADPKSFSPIIRKHNLTTSFLQSVPGARKWHRHLLPLYPLAIEQFDLREYDLVISSESGPAKGVLTTPRTCHVCYCHTPMRYIWDSYHQYRASSGLGLIRKAAFSLSAHYIRLWDHATAARVDYFAANSYNVAARIRKFYRRESEVIYPPVDVSQVNFVEGRGEYYLCVGQLVAYKRMELAVQACTTLKRPLRIVGVGEEYRRLRRLAGKSVMFLGSISDTEVREQYAGCRALLFPGEEDFGIVPVEAQAFGKPVIAFGRGGVRETVIPLCEADGTPPELATGIFFEELTPNSLIEAVRTFESIENRFSGQFIRANAQRFDRAHFLQRMADFSMRCLEDYSQVGPQKARLTTV